jgi:hypothetical protein
MTGSRPLPFFTKSADSADLAEFTRDNSGELIVAVVVTGRAELAEGLCGLLGTSLAEVRREARRQLAERKEGGICPVTDRAGNRGSLATPPGARRPPHSWRAWCARRRTAEPGSWPSPRVRMPR